MLPHCWRSCSTSPDRRRSARSSTDRGAACRSVARGPTVISTSKAGYALDASALLALLFNEPGQEKVSAVINRAYIHSVNVAEVAGKLVRQGVPRAEAEQMIEELNLDIDEELPTHQAALCGELVAQTRQQGLS